MAERDYDWIARRAYSLWEEEGRPHGRDDTHWLNAVHEWETLQAAAAETTAKAGRRIAKAQASGDATLNEIEHPLVRKASRTRSRKG